MSVTILEALMNAQVNLVENAGHPLARALGIEQLNNAITLLEKGYQPHELVEPLLAQHGSADAAPDCQAENSHDEVARLRERVRVLEAEVRQAFDAAFIIGVHAGYGLAGGPEAEAAKRMERLPRAAMCDQYWAEWQGNRARLAAHPPEHAEGKECERGGNEAPQVGDHPLPYPFTFLGRVRRG